MKVFKIVYDIAHLKHYSIAEINFSKRIVLNITLIALPDSATMKYLSAILPMPYNISMALAGCQALLGQKYGYRPFPPTIDADEFSAIRAELAAAAAADGNDQDAGGNHQVSLELLDTWFKRNTNVLPAVYTLQPISSVLPDYALETVIDYTFI